jgi:hypothetical protein
MSVSGELTGLEIHIVVGAPWVLLTFFIAFAIVFIKAFYVALDAAYWLMDWWSQSHWWKRRKGS